MLPLVPRNGRLLWEPDLDRFVGTIEQFDTFDVIVVDGPARGRTRLKCARARASSRSMAFSVLLVCAAISFVLRSSQ